MVNHALQSTVRNFHRARKPANAVLNAADLPRHDGPGSDID